MFVLLILAIGVASASGCACIHKDVVSSVDEALYKVSAASGSLSSFHISGTAYGDVDGLITVSIPQTAASCDCGTARKLRYVFPIIDVVGVLSDVSATDLQKHNLAGCFVGSCFLKISKGPSPAVSLDVVLSEGDRNPAISVFGDTNSGLLQLGKWTSFTSALNDGCSLLYISCAMTFDRALKTVAGAWKQQTFERLKALPDKVYAWKQATV